MHEIKSIKGLDLELEIIGSNISQQINYTLSSSNSQGLETE